MKQLPLTAEQLLEPVQWEATGRSPANSPQAVAQAAMTVAQFAMDPRSGLDLYELVKAIVANGPLANSKVQTSKEDMLALTGMGGPGGLGVSGPMAEDAGGAMPPGLPPDAPIGPNGELPLPSSEF